MYMHYLVARWLLLMGKLRMWPVLKPNWSLPQPPRKKSSHQPPAHQASIITNTNFPTSQLY